MISTEQKARLRWQCRRGMLELDMLLDNFLQKRIDSLDAAQYALLDNLLNCQDPDLYAWLMGHASPSDVELESAIALIKAEN
jgi:antitoxin CptB